MSKETFKSFSEVIYRESLRPVLGQGPKFSVLVPAKKKSREFVQKKFSNFFKKIQIFSSIAQAFWRICLKNATFFFAIKPMGHESKLIIFLNFKTCQI